MNEKPNAAVPDNAALPPPPPRQRPWRRPLLYALALTCAFLAGFAAAVWTGRAVRREFQRHPERIPPAIVKRMERKLDLTEEQTRQVRAIIETHYAALIRIRDATRPAVVRELAGARKEIDAVLTPDQRKEFAVMVAGARRMWGLPPAVDIPQPTPDAP